MAATGVHLRAALTTFWKRASRRHVTNLLLQPDGYRAVGRGGGRSSPSPARHADPRLAVAGRCFRRGSRIRSVSCNATPVCRLTASLKSWTGRLGLKIVSQRLFISGTAPKCSRPGQCGGNASDRSSSLSRRRPCHASDVSPIGLSGLCACCCGSGFVRRSVWTTTVSRPAAASGPYQFRHVSYTAESGGQFEKERHSGASGKAAPTTRSFDG